LHPQKAVQNSVTDGQWELLQGRLTLATCKEKGVSKIFDGFRCCFG
jgi:hypothetical protein